MSDEPPAGSVCPHCQSLLTGALCNASGMTECPACRGLFHAAVFPALFRPVEKGTAGEPIGPEGDAGCFYHASRKAVLACEGCGRFLCARCDVPMAGQHLCPACIESGKKKGKFASLDRHRVLYDEIALAMTVYPLVVPFVGWFMTPLTAPASLYVALRYWKEPLSIVRRSRWRFVLALLFATSTLVAWALLIAAVVWSVRSKP